MTHFYKTNFSLIASLLLCFAPMVAGADNTIWQGDSGDLNIRWTEADITAMGADENILFSARALAEKDFEADFLAEQSLDKDNPCEYERSFTLLSVVGNIASLEDAQYINCQSMPHPSVETRFMAIDLAQSGQMVKLTEFFAKSDILKALLADAVIKSALKKSGAKTPATLTTLYEALEWSHITVKDCEYRLTADFLSRFAFHHVKKNQVALRLDLPPVAHVCNSTNIKLGFYLSIPSAWKKTFDNARRGKVGFLMEQRQKIADQKSTKVSFSTETYSKEKVCTTESKQVDVEYHTVVSGEALYSIAKKYAHSITEIAAWNDLQPPYNLSIGQKLQVSAPVLVVATETRIQKDTIHKTLPEFVFKLIGEAQEEHEVAIKAIEICRDNKSEPFQTLKAGTPVSELKIEDINFDSYKDIRLMANSGVNTYYLCWLFEPETAQFVFSEAFSEIALLEVDAEKQLIKSTWKVNAADHEGTDFYKVIDNKPVLVKREEIYREENRVKVVVQERVGDEMKIVSEKIKSESKEPVTEEPVTEKPVTEKQAKERVKQRIMIASGVNVRSAPKLNARRLGELSFGTVVKELARSKNRVKIGKTKDYWYQIEMPGGEIGWTFGNLSSAIAPNKKGETYLEIAQQRLLKKLNWSNQKALLDFLAQVKEEVQSPPEIAVELALLYFSTLQKKLDQLSNDNQPEKSPYHEWLKELEQKELINPIGDDWIINADVYWQLHNAYYPLPVAERIAWVGANAPLGGECEGFLECALDWMNHTSLKYLKYHPTGEHVEKVINELMELLNNDMVEVTEKDVALPRLLAVLQSTVERINHPDKSKILRKIKERQQLLVK
ncbi:MAG: hypothetical protein DRQ41_04680 [Gammaproteobacteria bacterium]|nr:MAG: hypothetical protein DRQ41_04680 [Gammaproteobacteria bacterium]